jgi:glutamate synthase domain-containing protein 1
MGFVADMKGGRSHRIVQMGLEMLVNLEHRGACGCDPLTGDGAGLLTQIPHDFFKKAVSFSLPKPGEYGVGMLFLPQDAQARKTCEDLVNRIVTEEGQTILGWRDVPVEPQQCGELSRKAMPVIRQVFVGKSAKLADDRAFERELFVLRKRIEHEILKAHPAHVEEFYFCSFSCHTIVYKGQLISFQIPKFFTDLRDPEFKSGLAMVHQRFSTNTFPSWKRAHPYRYVIHNGEINTLRGNVNWMRAREKMFKSDLFGKDLEKIIPVVDEDTSDSGMFDNVLELLVHTGRSLPHAVMMMIPEAWQKNELMSPEKKAFCEYHACLMEPWDGPASIGFTDGRVVGAVLDRNGLRPSRYVVTKDGLIILSSEVGVIEVPAKDVQYKERLHPGRMLLVDLAEGRIIADEELKGGIAKRKPYRQWLDENLVRIEKLPAAKTVPGAMENDELLRQQRAFGYTVEDLKILLTPMALNGQEAVGSMGVDTPLAVLSNRPQNLFNYFKQLFAQVTNPPIDPLREDMVMSAETTIGSEQNLFEETAEHCHQVRLASPSLSNAQLAQLKELKSGKLFSRTLSTLYPTFIHGHTHRPATHDHIVDGIHVERWVLADWHGRANWLQVDRSGWALRSL